MELKKQAHFTANFIGLRVDISSYTGDTYFQVGAYKPIWKDINTKKI